MIRHTFLDEILEIGQRKMAKLGLWKHLCVVIFGVQNIDHHLLLQVLLEVLVVVLNLFLERLRHHLLEELLILVPVDVYQAFIVLLQGVKVRHFPGLFIFCVLLDTILTLLLLCF